jgi:sigma-B regulation protein RsbU (phosphoserine phosphatase)
MPRLTIDRRAGLRGALLFTLPGRAIVVGVALKLAVFVATIVVGAESPFLSVVDRVAGLAVAAGAGYFVIQLIVLAKRRLLWRVRRKMMLSYIFIGFVPAFFLVAFSLLCGFLLFLNFSSYLVQARLQLLSEHAELLAESAALEIQRAGGRDVAGILAHRQANGAEKYADV